jgi:hypothetical protein
MIATLIPPGTVAGNSLGVAYFRDDNSERLSALLGVMSSLCFELQLRAILATGHVSLSSLRLVHIPELSSKLGLQLASTVRDCLSKSPHSELRLEATAAAMYQFNDYELTELLDCFPSISEADRDAIQTHFAKLTKHDLT